MATSQPQVWKTTAFSIERVAGKAPGTLIFRFSGPFTAREMYGSLTPLAFESMLAFKSTPGENPPALNILDLTGVPYVDSKGLGMIVDHHSNCQAKGVRMVAAGAGPRVMDLFQMTRVDTILSLAATVEEVDIP
jgi:anti-anti-sigma factor